MGGKMQCIYLRIHLDSSTWAAATMASCVMGPLQLPALCGTLLASALVSVTGNRPYVLKGDLHIAQIPCKTCMSLYRSLTSLASEPRKHEDLQHLCRAWRARRVQMTCWAADFSMHC